jgi:hypothetical protein
MKKLNPCICDVVYEVQQQIRRTIVDINATKVCTMMNDVERVIDGEVWVWIHLNPIHIPYNME